MKRYKIILVLLLFLLYFFGKYFDYMKLHKNKNAFLSDFNISIIDMQEKLLEGNQSFYDANFTFWEMRRSKILEKREKELLLARENNKSNALAKEKNLTLTQRVICLGKECWEFLGVLTIDNKTVVTLLSMKKKGKLQNFQLHDMLLKNIEIIDIKSDSMKVIDRKKNKIFNLKLFEIDILKYQPKKNKKEKNE